MSVVYVAELSSPIGFTKDKLYIYYLIVQSLDV